MIDPDIREMLERQGRELRERRKGDQDAAWDRYVKNWKARESQPCMAEAARRAEVMRLGLPPNTPIAVSVVCPCPRCSPGSAVAR